MLRVFSAVTMVAASAALAAMPSVAVAQPTPVHVAVRVSRGPWSATLKPAGRLPNDPKPPGGLENDAALTGGGPVIGGDTLAIIGFPSFRTQTPELLLYTKAAGGWSAAKAPAMYPFPAQDSSFSIAVGSGLVAVRGDDPSGPPPPSGTCGTPVFTAGPGGFTGTLTPAACLDLPSYGGLGPASANTIVAQAAPSTLEVFTEPAGGWSGTVEPAAQLQASDGAGLESASMSGTTIAAVGGRNTNTVYIFNEPVGGWSGVIHESARLPLSGITSATLSGKTLVALGAGDLRAPENHVNVRAPVFVLHRPAAGWQAITKPPQPRAFVLASNPNENGGLARSSLLGATTAFTNVTECADQGNPPCWSTIFAINGLSSTVAAPEQLLVNPSTDVIHSSDGTPITTDGTTIALGAEGVALYSMAHTAPARVTHAALTGVIGPRSSVSLRLTVGAGKGASALASLLVLVPTQLGGKGRARTLTLKPAKRTATVMLRHLRPTDSLRRTVNRIAAHGGRTAVTVPVKLIDTTGHSSESQVTFTITR